MPEFFSSSSTFPVTNKAHVDALTNDECDCPRCLPHSLGAILSSISASIVSSSGTRSNASARHISATPSSVERPYSLRNNSIMPVSSRSLMRSTSSMPRSDMRLRRFLSIDASEIKASKAAISSTDFADLNSARSCPMPILQISCVCYYLTFELYNYTAMISISENIA